MGWDAFGLPAENYALENKTHPRVATEKNVETFKRQLAQLGFTYDWDREINTTDPEFYKWTQWIFLEMFRRGLAYESNEPINWCPSCKTGLANEDLENGRCERCGSVVEKKPIRQWVLKITAYADRMLNDLEKLPDWEESIKVMQKNWIGRKEGIDIDYEIEGLDQKLSVFTTRPDTNFGATFIVAAPDSDFVTNNLDKFPNKKEAAKYVEEAKNKSEIERISEGRVKTGVATGWAAINNLTGKRMPIYVGDFVLASVGTGIVVGVPGHDIRDFEFAQAMGLDVIRVVVGKDGDASPITKPEQVQEEEGVMINSEFLDGLDIHAATKKIMDYIEEKGWGRRTVSYKIKDWVFSRQRYWGEPFPLVYCEHCKAEVEKYVFEHPDVVEKIKHAGIKEKAEKINGFTAGEIINPGWVGVSELPVTLPEVEHYEPTGTGESPLANIKEWVEIKCPKCGGPAKRETNTMPQWAGSSWYYLRYIDPRNNEALVDKEKEKYWSPVDFYVGGAEHATRHLIYARFWHKFLFDIGAVSYDEPFTRLQHVGLILAEDGRKMSKRWNNVINPDEVVEKFGADAMRVYEMFMGPFSQPVAWSTNGLIGGRKFLERVWKLKEKVDGKAGGGKDAESGKGAQAGDDNAGSDVNKIDNLLHKTIKKVGEDIESFKFNTGIAQMMILVNHMSDAENITKGQYAALLKILSPFAPHLTEELWNGLGHAESIFKEEWPKFDPELIKDETIELVVQVNGKVRDTISAAADISEEEAKKIAQESANVKKWVEGKKIEKVVFVKGKLVSIVAK
ncbi:MAG: class I tRNA ligase family protein, partial [Patescibacteria group bacterium]